MQMSRAIDLAREQRPTALGAQQEQRMVEEALAHQSEFQTRDIRWVMLPAMIVAAASLMWWMWPVTDSSPTHHVVTSEPQPEPSSDAPAALPSTIELPNGDQIVASSGAQFRVLEASLQTRTIELEAGSVLFSVKPLLDAGSFTVNAPGLQVHVTGTVFSVQVLGKSESMVQVYEGTVDVVIDGATHQVKAGEQLDSRGLQQARQAGPLTLVALEFAAAHTKQRESDVVNKPKPQARRVKPTLTPTPTAKPKPESLRPRPSSPVSQDSAPQERTAQEVGQELLVQGKFAKAYEVGKQAALPILQGDALRAQGRYEEAVLAYKASKSPMASYLAAQLLVTQLARPAQALRLLKGSSSVAANSPIRERATALQMKAAHQALMHDEAGRIAKEYLDLFPQGAAHNLAEELSALP